MAKLAIAVGDESLLAPDRVRIRVAVRTGQAAYRQLGEAVLAYRLMADAIVMFLGRGRVVAIKEADAGFQLCQLAAFEPFNAPVLSEAEARIPGARRMLSLTAERFEEIVAAGLSEASVMAAEEATALYRHDRAEAVRTYARLHDLVLARWGHRCAFTERRFEPASNRPHPALRVVSIRPRELGGPLHARNYLPMVEDVETAWRSGHLALGDDFGFEVAKALIDPELEDRLRPIGRLLLPDNPEHWPDREHLAFHRERLFDRK